MTDPGLNSRARSRATLFLAICLPVSLVLSLATSPFGVPDESKHFLRAVGIANGQMLPEASYDPERAGYEKRIAGGPLDRNVIFVSEQFEQARNIEFKMSPGLVHRVMQRKLQGAKQFAEYDNTSLYPPILYLGSALAALLGMMLTLPILAWLYIGRVLNVLVSTYVIWWSIRESGARSTLILVIASLPIVLFQTSSISADALLFPFFILFAVLLKRLVDETCITRRDLLLLSAATVVISTGKVAYLPMAVLPFLFDRLKSRLWTRQSTHLFLLTIFTSLLWALWSYAVHDKVFSMRSDAFIDPMSQLSAMLARPMAVSLMFAKNMAAQSPFLAIDAVGRNMAFTTVHIKGAFCLWIVVVLVLVSAFGDPDSRIQTKVLSISVAVSAVCAIATFVLLYLQYNSVGSNEIIGAQGRYFTPILIIFFTSVPKIARPKIISKSWIEGLAIATSVTSCALTMICVVSRYWLS